jgi:hypothetical protein
MILSVLGAEGGEFESLRSGHHTLLIFGTMLTIPTAHLLFCRRNGLAFSAKWNADPPGLDANWGRVAFAAHQCEQAIGPL